MQFELDSSSMRGSRVSPGIRITDRDFEILNFLIEMKFAESADLQTKFFEPKRVGSVLESRSYVKERLSLLRKHGLSISKKHPFKWTSIHLPTQKAYRLVKDRYPNLNIPRVPKTYDLNSFEHDLRVIKIRLILEELLGDINWVSDRELRSTPEATGGMTGHMVPDGIYTDSQNRKVAFELELSRKSRVKYRDKIRMYIKIISDKRGTEPFEAVHFVVAKNFVLEMIKTETRLYPDLFLIEPLSKYELLGKTNINNKKGN